MNVMNYNNITSSSIIVIITAKGYYILPFLILHVTTFFVTVC